MGLLGAPPSVSRSGPAGNDVNDAYLAASAFEARCRLVTLDGGFNRFPGLDWWNPLSE